MREIPESDGPAQIEGPAHRSVDVEEMRRYAQDQVELTSIRHIAAEAGLGRTTMHKFVAGETMPHPRVRRLLGLWYLNATRGTAGAAATQPETALNVLAGYFPAEVRPRLIHSLLDQMEQLAGEIGGEPLDWIAYIRTQTPQPLDFA